MAVVARGFVGQHGDRPVRGAVVVRAGYGAAFLILAAIAALGGALFWLAVPETRMVPGPAALAVPAG